MSEPLKLPGFVDLHVHFREPGSNNAETIKNGSFAAMLGGFVLVCDMPNNPGNPTWSVKVIKLKRRIADDGTFIPVEFYAGSQPESDNLDELEEMAPLAIGLKLYGSPTTGNKRIYSAEDFTEIVDMWHAVAPEKPIMLHAGKDNLEGFIDLVARKNRHPLHVCHINEPLDVHKVNDAKKEKLDVTSGITPHHIFLTSHDVKSRGWLARMQPRLVSQIKSEALWGMFVNGDIDVLETDYAPHTKQSKLKAEIELPHGEEGDHHKTCYGVGGIESVGGMMLRQLDLEEITQERLEEAMFYKPLEIIRREPPNDTYVLWSKELYEIQQEHVASGSGSSPYIGSYAVGKVLSVVIEGKERFVDIPSN